MSSRSVPVILPEMGESVTEGTITRWLVGPGDRVEIEQPLVEISTDKVDAEIPSPVAGVVGELRFAAGDIVEIDSVLALIETEGEGPDPSPAPRADDNEAVPAPAPATVPAAAGTAAADPRAAAAPSPRRPRATPLARKIAAERSIDLARLRGSGIGGRITRRDVEAAEEEPAMAAAAPPPQPDGAFSVPAYLPSERVTIEPMSRIRRLTARHMVYSQATSVHVTTVYEIDMSAVVAARTQAAPRFAETHGTKLTFMPYIFKAAVAALEKHPKFNAAVDGEDIVYKRDIHLGMAVATERGLLVPVLHHADDATLAELAVRANDLAERARTRRLKPDEIQRGTFTVTNPGVYGSLFGTPIINQPQVAILCVGTIEKRPVVVDDGSGGDAIAIRHRAYMALTYDHRLIDGADAEMFMTDLRGVLESSEWPEP